MHDLYFSFIFGYRSAKIIKIDQDLTRVSVEYRLLRFYGP